MPRRGARRWKIVHRELPEGPPPDVALAARRALVRALAAHFMAGEQGRTDGDEQGARLGPRLVE